MVLRETTLRVGLVREPQSSVDKQQKSTLHHSKKIRVGYPVEHLKRLQI